MYTQACLLPVLGWQPQLLTCLVRESACLRRHPQDAIGVCAILLLIPYLAACFMQKGDGDPRFVDAVVWSVHPWHMPLFFATSGFLAASALSLSSAARQ